MAGVLGEGTVGLHFSDLEREESQGKILLSRRDDIAARKKAFQKRKRRGRAGTDT